MTSRKFHVLVDARIQANESGGVQQNIISLADGFAKDSCSEFQFTWFLKNDCRWLVPYLPNGSRVILAQTHESKFQLVWQKIRSFIRSSVPSSFVAIIRKRSPFKIELQDTPKDLDGKTFDLIHFPFQNGFKTHLPNLYQPHDLQHLHLPKFFSEMLLRLENSITHSCLIRQTLSL